MVDVKLPSWANSFGKDKYGYWANLRIKEQGQCFRWIEAGEFIMGSDYDEFGPDDEYPHKVKLSKGFWLADTTCTQELWQLVMGDNPSKFKGKDLPVENVSSVEVDDFIQKINSLLETTIFDLPTETQWEYACRAGTDTEYNYGNCASNELMNVDKYQFKQSDGKIPTVAVKSFARNNWGLYQMHGNVFEWCSDWWFDNWRRNSVIAESKGIVIDPANLDREDSLSRIMRGGSWFHEAYYSRSACRGSLFSDWKCNYVGFRILVKED